MYIFNTLKFCHFWHVFQLMLSRMKKKKTNPRFCGSLTTFLKQLSNLRQVSSVFNNMKLIRAQTICIFVLSKSSLLVLN